jgi:hypothetical protein
VELTAGGAREVLEAATAGDSTARAELARSWAEIVALCCVDPEARAALRDLRDPVAALGEEGIEGADWIALVLGVLHEEPFVAIDVAARTGITGRMSGIVDNFQLHTLLMDAFPETQVSEAAVRVARGEGEQQIAENVTGAWNLWIAAALSDRGELPPKEAIQEFMDLLIWNEGTPADIPPLDGHRVILLGEPSYERFWDASRAFPHLPATLDARPLSEDEVTKWLARCSHAG